MDIRRIMEETNFDNVSQLSKRWKVEDKPNIVNRHKDEQLAYSPKQIQVAAETKRTTQGNNLNHFDNSDYSLLNSFAQPQSLQVPARSEQQPNPKKRNLIPQVMDQDTQHFRNRLQNLLNSFKTDAVSQFMGMKKAMLQYQRDCVKTDTQKYLALYEEKHQQLVQTKEKLIVVSQQAQKKTAQCQLMSDYIAKLNDRIKITRYLSRPFALLYENKEREKMIKFKLTQAAKADNRRIKIKALNGWRNILRETAAERSKKAAEKTIEMQVNDIVGRFQKEMQTLREKLAEATHKNEQYEANKHMMQENLKKAFLRGISAMNMQAMGIFTTEEDLEQDLSMMEQSGKKDNEEFVKNTSLVENHPMGFSRTGQQNLNQSAIQSLGQTTNNSFIPGKPRIESKDHKWKQAPILGVEQKIEIEQPRTQIVRPATEGKVIKVVDGKSAVTALTDQSRKTTTSTSKQPHSRKKI